MNCDRCGKPHAHPCTFLAEHQLLWAHLLCANCTAWIRTMLHSATVGSRRIQPAEERVRTQAIPIPPPERVPFGDPA